ncbi:redoxin domain-containing protein [uncultured Sunxiuqinia sp.]|uniref:redoxin domain-containing protein n=1 Tax=uncultured Sunxiuqinia sp. TaxID=1573825 RepID=UPI0037482E40
MRIYTLSIAIFFVGTLHSQNKQIPLIASQAPSFTTQSTNGKFTFSNDFEKSWKVLFCHPQDFTPVCSSELLELAYLQDDLKNLNVQFAVIFTDNVSQHSMWKAHVEELDYKGRFQQKSFNYVWHASYVNKYKLLHKRCLHY